MRFPLEPVRCGATFGVLIMMLLPAAAVAQDHQARYIADFERMRGNVIAMVDAMPDAGLRSAPTEGVRDFAEQIEHVAGGNVNLIASGVDAGETDLGLDPEVYLNDKTELKRFVNASFDRVRDMLSGMSQDDFMAEGQLFGQISMPKWRIVQAAHEHGVWTLGATIPYVRLAGGTPPSYGLVPEG